jgi:hypothetical protein
MWSQSSQQEKNNVKLKSKKRLGKRENATVVKSKEKSAMNVF